MYSPGWGDVKLDVVGVGTHDLTVSQVGDLGHII